MSIIPLTYFMAIFEIWFNVRDFLSTLTKIIVSLKLDFYFMCHVIDFLVSYRCLISAKE